MNNEKWFFLKNDLLKIFDKLDNDAKPLWGFMNAQQMVEHFSETLRYANGKTILPLFTPAESLPKLRTFMLSEKPFRENTKNPIMEDMPAPFKHSSMEEALAELRTEINDFFKAFAANEMLITQNPIFGELTSEQNIHLLYKHAMHHLKQFGLM